MVPTLTYNHKDNYFQYFIFLVTWKNLRKRYSFYLPFFLMKNSHKKTKLSKLNQVNKIKLIAASNNNNFLAVTGDYKVHILVNKNGKK